MGERKPPSNFETPDEAKARDIADLAFTRQEDKIQVLEGIYAAVGDKPFAPADVKVLEAYGITHTTTKVAVDKNRVILWRGSGEVDEKTWETILSGLASS